jgi:hypothetical protein
MGFGSKENLEVLYVYDLKQWNDNTESILNRDARVTMLRSRAVRVVKLDFPYRFGVVAGTVGIELPFVSIIPHNITRGTINITTRRQPDPASHVLGFGISDFKKGRHLMVRELRTSTRHSRLLRQGLLLPRFNQSAIETT